MATPVALSEKVMRTTDQPITHYMRLALENPDLISLAPGLVDQESLPVADKVLSPPWVENVEDWDLFGYSLEETRRFAGTCLARRLKVIGLA